MMGLIVSYRILQYHLFVLLLIVSGYYVKCSDEQSDFDYNENANHFLKFTYSDGDAIYGPKRWEMIEDAADTSNTCYDNWRSPINIITELAASHEKIRFIDELDEFGRIKTLIFSIGSSSQGQTWTFGYPIDIFHGVVVKPPYTGIIQLIDLFDPIHDDAGNVMYNLEFVSFHYCDLNDHPNRSMHQIDGNRFPLEIQMIFFKNAPHIGIDSTLTENSVIMLSILGKIEGKDNPRLEPLIEAAKKFRGVKEFNLDEADFEKLYASYVKIKGPWSPSWLIPDTSPYYYYNEASFTVPPCFRISRVYIPKAVISISKRQFEVLKNIKSEREPGGLLKCTFSMLQNDLDDIRYNSNDYDIRGMDGRPMISEQSNSKEKRTLSKILGAVESTGSVVRINYKHYFKVAICWLLLSFILNECK